MLLKQSVDKIILDALNEDMNYGDITCDALLKASDQAAGQLIAKEAGVIAGLEVFCRVFELLEGQVNIETFVEDGEMVPKGKLLASVSGQASTLLMGERTALNLMQRMSGIATMTASMVKCIEGTGVRLVDTRKTAPNLRILDKWAVRLGGGHNHRYNLSDAVMIKDNHIRAVGSITEAVKRARDYVPHTTTIEVETETLEQVQEAISAGADIIMLDNMSPSMMKSAVQMIDGLAISEASGNISLETLAEVAATGVRVISTGAITHSVKALDISLKFD